MVSTALSEGSSQAPRTPASLNWREIDAVLDEVALPGSFIRDVRQPTIRELVWELYLPRGPGGSLAARRYWLLTSFHERYSRLNPLPAAPPRPATMQRFVAFLRARIVGCRIQSVEQLSGNRIVRLQLSRGEQDLLLWWRLWGSASNCVVTDASHVVLDALLRRPGRDEVSGGRFATPESIPPGSERYHIREFPGAGSFGERVAGVFAASEAADREALYTAATQRARAAAAARLERLVQRLQDEVSATADYARFRELGTLILSNLAAVEVGARWLHVTDHNNGEEVQIEMRPLLSGPQNAQQYFDRAKEQRRRHRAAAGRLDEAVADVQRVAAVAGEESDQPAVLVPEKNRRGQAQRHRGGGGSGEVGLRLQSGAFTILVGRSAAENDLLLRNHARGSDYWLHCRDSPGSHVFVLAVRGKSVPLATLLDAGNLAVFYNKARRSARADVYYTQVKHLRRVRGGAAGRVLPTHERNLDIRLDKARIDRLLSGLV
jgi:predicted ribosome quality control (RQC) complex YloA/Tae2 family protein